MTTPLSKVTLSTLVDAAAAATLTRSAAEKEEKLLKAELKKRFKKRKGDVVSGSKHDCHRYYGSGSSINVKGLKEKFGEEAVNAFTAPYSYQAFRFSLKG